MFPVSSSLPTLVCTDLRKQVNVEAGTRLQLQGDLGVISSHAEYQLWGVSVISLGLGVFTGKIESANNDYMTFNHVCQVPRIWGFPGGAMVKESACQCRSCKRHRFDPWVRKIPWRRKWQPTPVFLPGNPTDRGASQATQSVGSQRIGHNWVSTSKHLEYGRLNNYEFSLSLGISHAPEVSLECLPLSLVCRYEEAKKSCALYHLSCLSIPLLPGLGDSSSKDKIDWALARQLVTTHFHFPWKEKLVSFMLADFWIKWN